MLMTATSTLVSLLVIKGVSWLDPLPSLHPSPGKYLNLISLLVKAEAAPCWLFGSEEGRQLPDRSLTDRKADISAQSSAPAGPCRYRGSHTLDQQLIFFIGSACIS